MTTASIQVHLEPDHLSLTLGERTSIEVEVFNGSPIVDEFRVDLVGPWVDPIRGEWVTARPSTLALFPNTSGVVVLTLDVPAASQLLAGRHVLGVRIRSMTNEMHSYVAELPVTVNSQPSVALHLDPQAAGGGSTASTHIVARNLGNVPVNLWLSMTDPANTIEYGAGETEVLLPPDEEARIPLHLRGRRPLLGAGIVRIYTVQADIEDRAGDVGAEATPYVEAIRTEGTFAQRARINGRVLTVLGFLLPVVAILAAAFILRPQPEAVLLSGPLTFGVAGVVERVEVRPGEFVLANHRIASMRGTEAGVAFEAARLALRRAIVDLEGLKTQHQVDNAGSVLEEEADTASPDFLQTLLDQLQATVSSARIVSSTSLIGLTDALARYCAASETHEDLCASQPVPVPSEFVETLALEAASDPLAKEVLDSNTTYRSAASTLNAVERLSQATEAALAAAGGVPSEGDEEPEATPAPDPAVLAALEAQAAQDQTDYELSLLERQSLIAEAQLACRAALQDVGRTVLRAPADIIVDEVLVSAGAEVDPDSPVVVVQRTDGRVFTPPAGNRSPAVEDLPEGATCPGSIDDLRAADAAG